jgi:ssDNA-binding Zn-finger/Zn-ribbon topoisomerase 1
LFAQDQTQTIKFSGYDWLVRNTYSRQGPGPNYFSSSCVRLDSKGWLHLIIKKDSTSGKWICPEVTTLKKFGTGDYCFVVEGAIDHFDKNIVLGLFNYSGNDGYDEMDIEIARWGNDTYPNLNYTIWPAKSDSVKQVSTTKEFSLKSTISTHCFKRKNDSVVCVSFDGLRTDPENLIYISGFAKPSVSISRLKMPVHINLWLFEGKPPDNQKAVEVVIRRFTFKSENL